MSPNQIYEKKDSSLVCFPSSKFICAPFIVPSRESKEHEESVVDYANKRLKINFHHIINKLIKYNLYFIMKNKI
jgi:hypothetical protein